MDLGLKSKLVLAIAVVGAILVAIFQMGFYRRPAVEKLSASPIEQKAAVQTSQPVSDKVQLVGTKPSPLDEAVLLPAQAIELTFDNPIQNSDEFKHTLNPPTPHTVKLSADKKTAIITPKATYEVGSGYTLSIKNDTKFDGGKRLEKDIEFHFRTLEYRGV